MAVERLISGLGRLQRTWQDRKRFRGIQREIENRLSHSSIGLHLTNASCFAAPGGLERYVLESARFAAEELKCSSLIVFPDPTKDNRVNLLADLQPVEGLELSDFERLLTLLSGSIRSAHIQHSMNWNLDRLKAVLNFAEKNVSRRVVYLHDYHFICRQHNLLWNDQQFCGPPESIENGLCASCVYGPLVRPYRTTWADRFQSIELFVAPSETAARIFVQAYPMFSGRVRVIPHLVVSEAGSAAVEPSQDEKISIVFSGATGFNKGIDRFSKLIAKYGARYQWVTVGIEDYYRDNPLVRHVPYNFHEQTGLSEILQQLKPAVAFLGSVVPETFSYTTHEMLAAGMPIVTTVESGNIAAVVDRLSAGRVYGSLNELEQAFEDGDSIRAIVRSAKRFRVELNRAGLREIYR
ncbi:MAG: hypothetical protein U0136_06925 [Bdellovibrionota bacterium]